MGALFPHVRKISFAMFCIGEFAGIVGSSGNLAATACTVAVFTRRLFSGR